MISVVSILIGLLIALLARNRKVGYRKSYGNGLNEETKAKKNYWYLYGMNLIVNVILWIIKEPQLLVYDNWQFK